MTTQVNEKLELTPEQYRKLGQVYQMILSWRHLTLAPQQCETDELSNTIRPINQNPAMENEA